MVPPGLRPVIDRALGHDKETRVGDCDQLTTLVAQAGNVSIARHGDTPAQGVAQSPDTPRPRPSDVRPATSHSSLTHPSKTQSSSKQPASARGSAAGAELPFDRLGAYEILERIGGGGMGDVYKAHDESLDRIVAIKVLPPELARQEDFVRRFRAEAMAIARLVHPNIVQVFAFGEDADRHFFAMQFVSGESLAQLLKRRTRLPVDEALPVFQQCLAGLGAAHERGMIHRDIKPGNILIDREHRRALVADFGLVKSADSGENLTATGVIMGTVDYIAPEQARGQNVDGRSDLYSLGALMYQTLSGRLPFIADSPTGMIFQHAFEQPKDVCEVAPDVPQEVGAIIMRLLAKDPSQRYATAKDVSAAIQAYRTGKKPGTAGPGGASAGLGAPGSKPGAGGASAGKSTTGSSVIGLPPLLAAPPEAGFAARLRALWRTHAPAALQDTENTQQQVDGAVQEYERRRDELATLARDAAAVAADFASQAANHRKAAAAAAHRAEKISDASASAKAREEQAKCERVAAELESQLAEQQEQSEAIQQRLAKVNGTLQKLRSQRDVLNARLKAANARLAAEGGPSRRSNKARLIAGGLAAGLILVLASVWVIVRDRAGSEIAKVEVPGSSAVVEVRNDPTLSTDRQVAEWVIESGGSVRPFVNGKMGNEIKSKVGLPDGPLSLANVSLYQREQVTDGDLLRLRGLANLMELNLQRTSITDDGLKALAGLTSLQQLDLSSTQVHGRGLKHLDNLNRLTSLAIVGNSIADEDPVGFPMFPSLTKLEIYRNKFSSLDFVRGLKTLELLHIGNTKVARLDAISELTNLKDLTLNNTQINDDALAVLQSLPQMSSRLNLHETNVTDKGLRHLEKLTHLQYLTLTMTPVTEKAIKTLQAALPNCKIEWDAPIRQPLLGPKSPANYSIARWQRWY